jgi:hypothetical protein
MHSIAAGTASGGTPSWISFFLFMVRGRARDDNVATVRRSKWHACCDEGSYSPGRLTGTRNRPLNPTRGSLAQLRANSNQIKIGGQSQWPSLAQWPSLGQHCSLPACMLPACIPSTAAAMADGLTALGFIGCHCETTWGELFYSSNIGLQLASNP